MKTRYKFINFVDTQDITGGYSIHNNKTGELLGQITWWDGWKSWCLDTIEEIVFSPSCLQDIIDFIKQLNLPDKLKMEVKCNGTECYLPILISGSVIKLVGPSYKTEKEAKYEGKRLLDLSTGRIKVCGNCEYWKTCKSKGEHLFWSPCLHVDGVHWKPSLSYKIL